MCCMHFFMLQNASLAQTVPEVSHFFDVPGWERRLAWDTQGGPDMRKKYG